MTGIEDLCHCVGSSVGEGNGRAEEISDAVLTKKEGCLSFCYFIIKANKISKLIYFRSSSPVDRAHISI